MRRSSSQTPRGASDDADDSLPADGDMTARINRLLRDGVSTQPAAVADGDITARINRLLRDGDATQPAAGTCLSEGRSSREVSANKI